MLRPADVQNVNIIRWQQEGREHQIPAVFHAAWQAPDGRLGIVLANWTTETQEVRVVDERLGDKVLVSVSVDSLESRMLSSADGNFMVTLPKLSFILLERVNN
jgi:O-glycosyl hydrolase